MVPLLIRVLAVVLALAAVLPATADAQPPRWAADLTAGYAAFVDDKTAFLPAVGGAVRRQLSPRVSVGPEFIVMIGQPDGRGRALMLTGNVVFNAYSVHGRDSRRLTPFLVGGLGMFWSREEFVTGPFWSSDPAFTAGGGLRGPIAERISVSAEYRIGWELHQRVTGTVTFELR